jgi:hypothetical protein
MSAGLFWRRNLAGDDALVPRSEDPRMTDFLQAQADPGSMPAIPMPPPEAPPPAPSEVPPAPPVEMPPDEAPQGIPTEPPPELPPDAPPEAPPATPYDMPPDRAPRQPME